MRKLNSLLVLFGLLVAVWGGLPVTAAAPSTVAGKAITTVHSPPSADFCGFDAVLPASQAAVKPPGAMANISAYLAQAKYNAPPLARQEHSLPYARADGW